MSNEEKTEPVDAPTEPAPLDEQTEPTLDEPATAEAVETDSKPVEEKPKEEKKPRTPRRKKKTAPTHPPYFEMIKEAITALDDSTGSSPYAIAKYMEEKHKDELPSNYKKVLAIQLKNFTAKGKLVKVRASFKLQEEEAPKKKKKPVKKEISKIPTKARSKRKAPVLANTEAKKKSTRSTRAKKAKKAAPPKPKQPKSIRSGTGKKANKAVAG